jgi:K+-sensing histidine kinase KdpD
VSEEWRELHKNISHNLRTPLAVIKGCTAMLLAHPDEEELDEDRRRELLVMTSENVERLADAITWLEAEIERVAGGRTIELPTDEGASPPAAPPGAGH